MLPNLLIIGAMKCGTTSLHEYLDIHPKIYMSKTKEIDFFCHLDKYDKGMDWYKQFFPVDVEIRGESSQNYSKYHWWKDVPKRIYQDLPSNTKFIYILRDPLKRIYSHYNEMQAQNCAPNSLEEYILDDIDTNEIVLTSCYKKQLDKFLDYIPLSSFKIVTVEELNKNKLKVLNEIFEFLNVEPIFDNELFNFSKNTSEEKKTRTRIGLFIASNPLVVWFKKYLPMNLKNYFKAKNIVNQILFRSINLDVQISYETEEKLKTIFKKDVNALRKLTGLPFDDWCV